MGRGGFQNIYEQYRPGRAVSRSSRLVGSPPRHLASPFQLGTQRRVQPNIQQIS